MGEIDSDFNDGDRLSKFFGLIKRFNHDRDMNLDQRDKIEEYFEYKWEYDCNQAVTTDEDFSLLAQLPHAQ